MQGSDSRTGNPDLLSEAERERTPLTVLASRDDQQYLERRAADCGGDPGVALSRVIAEAVQLGLVAHRVGQRIEWDAANLKARNLLEADRFIRPEYRKGWEL